MLIIVQTVKLPKVTMDSETENISTDSDEQVTLKLNSHPVCVTYAIYEKSVLNKTSRVLIIFNDSLKVELN